tara:strand:+ start:2623 stop:3153 length:531 start_codon:yes stop_codon:yes gene_type:complete
MKLLCSILLLTCSTPSLFAETNAREALQILERNTGQETISQVVAIVGFHGADQPNRWQILALDPANEGVLREYVIQNDTVTGPKSIPRQEGEDLPQTPVFLTSMKLNSTDVYQIADDQAIEAGVGFAKVNYQLRWRGNDPEPTWLATLLSSDNQVVGRIYVMAASGTVIHRDFARG